MQAMEELLHANATFSYVDGDKTVPSESATADGLDATERVGIKADHRCAGRGAEQACSALGCCCKCG